MLTSTIIFLQKNMRIYLLLIYSLSMSHLAMGQSKLDWSILSDVKFRQKLIKKYNSSYLIPKFGKQPMVYEGKEVMLSGYLIPLSADFSQLVLSRSPYTSCFFCGQSGPETVVELELNPKVKTRRYRMDDYVEVKGILHLNREDVQSLPYKVTEVQIEKTK